MQRQEDMPQAVRASVLRAKAALNENREWDIEDFGRLCDFERFGEVAELLEAYRPVIGQNLRWQSNLSQQTRADLLACRGAIAHFGRRLIFLKQAEPRLVFQAFERIAWRLARILSPEGGTAEDTEDLQTLCDRLRDQFSKLVARAELEWAVFAKGQHQRDRLQWLLERLQSAPEALFDEGEKATLKQLSLED